MSRPTLSVCVTTRDSADRLSWWFERVRPYADEILVAVDIGSTDDTFDVATRHADGVTAVELAGCAEPSRDWLASQSRGDWVLSLDDDEALPRDAERLLGPLLADRRYTSYGFPVRWVVADADGQLVWIRSHPWYSTHWLRLWRNIPGLYFAPGAVHSTPLVLGSMRALPSDGEMALYHMNLLWSPRSAREAKGERYKRTAAPGETTAVEYYLYEDYQSTQVVAPLSAGESFPATFPPRPPTPIRLQPSPVVTYQQLQDHLRDREPARRIVS